MFLRSRWFSLIAMCRRLGGVFSIVFILASNLWAAESACLERTLPVTVKDKDNKLIEGLRPEDFHGTFRKQPVEVLSVEWDVGPRSLGQAPGREHVVFHRGSRQVRSVTAGVYRGYCPCETFD